MRLGRRGQVRRGQVIAVPGTVTPHRRFRTALYALTAAEGGRRTPFAANYRPRSSLLLLSCLLGERFAGTPYSKYFLASES